MPMTKEERKEYNKQYHLKNKEKVAKQKQGYRIKNKEKISKDKKEFNKTPQGKKSHRISTWKQRGILCFDYNLLYDIFLSTNKCEYCNCELTIDRYTQSTTRCLDHDHSITDKFNVRGVLCNSCNIKDVLS